MACVSAADPDLQQNMRSCMGVILLVTLFAMYDPSDYLLETNRQL